MQVRLLSRALVVVVAVVLLCIVITGCSLNVEGACLPGGECYGATPTTQSAYPPPPTEQVCGSYPGPNEPWEWCYDAAQLGPVSTIDGLPFLTKTSAVTLTWTGRPEPGTHIVQYDIFYQVSNGGWVGWASFPPSVTEALFTFGPEGQYDFEVRAIDSNGYTEALSGNPEATTYADIEPPFIEAEAYLPMVIGP